MRLLYGVVLNLYDFFKVSGGLSFGSVVVVVCGVVVFFFGIDMVGLGCVLVGFNNIVGLKLLRGVFSVRGVVLVCRIFDCVFIFVMMI